MGAISSWRFDTSVEFQVDTGIAGQWGEAAQLLHRRLQSASSLHWRWPLPAVSWRPNTAADSAMALSPRVSRCDAAHAWRQRKVALWNRDWESPGWLIWGYQSQNLQWWTIPKLWGLIIGDNSLFCGTALRTDQSLLQYSGVDIVDQKGTLGTQTGLRLFQSKPFLFEVAKEPFVCVCALASLDVWPPVRCLGLLDSFGRWCGLLRVPVGFYYATSEVAVLGAMLNVRGVADHSEGTLVSWRFHFQLTQCCFYSCPTEISCASFRRASFWLNMARFQGFGAWQAADHIAKC